MIRSTSKQGGFIDAAVIIGLIALAVINFIDPANHYGAPIEEYQETQDETSTD